MIRTKCRCKKDSLGMRKTLSQEKPPIKDTKNIMQNKSAKAPLQNIDKTK